MKARILYYDISRTLAIFCVILGDVYCLYDERGTLAPVSVFVHTFHTALFMFISGVFFRNALQKNIVSVAKSKSRQLLVPYLFWSVVVLLLVKIPLGGLDNIASIINSFLFFGVLKNYWYLKALFVYIIITYILVKLLRNEIMGCIASFLLFTFMPSFFNTSLFIPYFIAGFFYRIIVDKYRGLDNYICVFTLALTLILFIFWTPVYNYNISASMELKPYVIRTTLSLCLSLFILTIIKIACTNNKLSRFVIPFGIIGNYTLGMYCCNSIFYNGFARKLLNGIGVPNNDVACFIVAIATFYFSYILCKRLERNKYTSCFFLGNKIS